jgi:hypothetical protein
MKNVIPFNYKNNTVNKRVVYIFLFFNRKRALLLNRAYELLGTMETRYAKKLIEEAKEQGWISNTWENYDGGSRPKGYPKKCDVAFWTEVKST